MPIEAPRFFHLVWKKQFFLHIQHAENLLHVLRNPVFSRFLNLRTSDVQYRYGRCGLTTPPEFFEKCRHCFRLCKHVQLTGSEQLQHEGCKCLWDHGHHTNDGLFCLASTPAPHLAAMEGSFHSVAWTTLSLSDSIMNAWSLGSIHYPDPPSTATPYIQVWKGPFSACLTQQPVMH